MSSAKLAFGVEIELLLRPSSEMLFRLNKSCPDGGWLKSLETVKQKVLSAQGKGSDAEAEAKKDAERIRALFRGLLADHLANCESFPITTKSVDFTEWSLVDEVSLDEIPGFCKFTVVSVAGTDDEKGSC